MVLITRTSPGVSEALYRIQCALFVAAMRARDTNVSDLCEKLRGSPVGNASWSLSTRSADPPSVSIGVDLSSGIGAVCQQRCVGAPRCDGSGVWDALWVCARARARGAAYLALPLCLSVSLSVSRARSPRSQRNHRHGLSRKLFLAGHWIYLDFGSILDLFTIL